MGIEAQSIDSINAGLIHRGKIEWPLLDENWSITWLSWMNNGQKLDDLSSLIQFVLL